MSQGESSKDAVISKEAAIGPDARLSWLLAGLAGMVGAVAFVHSAGYFVTFMTGNSERAVLSWYPTVSNKVAGAGPVTAICLIASFVGGIFVASWCRRRFWKNHPHGATVLTTCGLLAAALIDFYYEGFTDRDVDVWGVNIVAFSLGALNTSFVKNGEVSVPLSYVTGTLVKLGQGLERHFIGDGTVYDWLGYLLLYAGFLSGAGLGGVLGSKFTGPQLLLVTGIVAGLTTVVTFFYTDKKSAEHHRPEQQP